MSFNEEILFSLQQAIAQTPNNPHLRRRLADLLLSQGDTQAAESEYRAALALAPHHVPSRLGLAEAFYHNGKDSAGLALLEDLQAEPQPPALAFLLSARFLARRQQYIHAMQAYEKAVDRDPNLQDEELYQQLQSVLYTPEHPLVASPQPEPLTPPALETPRKANFADIGGMENLKAEIRLKMTPPLEHRELYQAYGKKMGGGLLMYGPPGCGKTHLARATAGEMDLPFFAVGIHDILALWLGQSERNLHHIFEQARAAAPSVLFFDEVDALAANRTDLRHNSGRQLINQFLAEMDGVQASNEWVLILAATNAPWHLDNAFRRPGRFDRIVFVPPPNPSERQQILALLLADKPTENMDLSELVKKTEGFSGADLKAIVELAIEHKLQAAIRTGLPLPLQSQDLLEALKQTPASTREWFQTARNYVLYANQGGLYDEVKHWLKLP